ncbi:MAG: response regulator [Limisphaerales bacterium]
MKTHLSVLISEDNPDEVFFLEKAFKEIEVAYHYIVSNGAEMIDYLQHKGRFTDTAKYQTVNCLIVDMHMPIINGLEVLQWLKDHPQYAKIPTILVTTYASPAQIEEGYELGAHTVFIKPAPLHIAELIKIIGNFWIHAAIFENPFPIA